MQTEIVTYKFSENINSNPSILVVAISPPLPESSGGAIAVAHTILELSKFYNYHLLLIGDEEVFHSVDGQREKYSKYFKTVTLVRREEIPKGFIGRILYFAERVCLGIPFLDINFYSKSAVEISRDLINKNSIDVLEMHTTHTAFFKHFNKQLPSMMLSQNIESELWPFWDRETPILLRPIFKFLQWYSRKRSFEVEIENCYQIEVETFVTPQDMCKVSDKVYKHYLPLSFHISSPVRKPHSEFNILWVGTFNWFPNVDAMTWFFKEVFPYIKEEMSNLNIHIYVAGVNPPEEIKKFDSKNVHIMGFVEDLDALYSISDVSIAPITSGGGVKTKVVESMSKGVAVIGTTAAFVGIGIRHNFNGWIADDPKEFAKGIVELAKKRTYCYNMGDEAFRYAKDVFDRKKALKKKSELYNELLSLKNVSKN